MIDVTILSQAEEIRKLEEEIDKLKSRKETMVKLMQDNCKHPEESLLESKSIPSSFGGTLFRPLRVCRLCGYAEEGWGAGYWKISNTYSELPVVSREVAWRFVRKFVSQEEMMRLGRY